MYYIFINVCGASYKRNSYLMNMGSATVYRVLPFIKAWDPFYKACRNSSKEFAYATAADLGWYVQFCNLTWPLLFYRTANIVL